MSGAWPPPPPPQPPAAPVAACYRHPKVPAPVACTRCGQPICTDCMISAPVGWQCPTCLKGAPPVRRMRDVQGGAMSLSGDRPYVTYGLIAACVAVFVAQQSPGVEDRFVIVASEVARGEWWRVVTSGFLHGGVIHLIFNMLVLFQLGTVFEGRIGRARFLAIYVVSLVGGSMGAMLLQGPTQAALSASGAVFGLMGAVLVLSRRGRSPIESGIGGLLAINLIITFVIPGISIGGHLGGLAAGAAGALIIRVVGERAGARRVALTTAAIVALTLGLFLAARPVAEARCAQQPPTAASVFRGVAQGIAPCP